MEQGLVRTDRAGTTATRNLTTGFRSPLAAIGTLRGAIAGLTGALGVRQVLSYAESYTRVQNQLRVRARPLLRNGPGFAVPVLVDTGEIGGNRQYTIAPEFAAVLGSWTFQAEWVLPPSW